MPKVDGKTLVSAISWPRGVDYSCEKNLIETGALRFERLAGRNDDYIFVSRPAAVEAHTTAAATTHWYRGMNKDEFDALFLFGEVKSDSYTGIAPNLAYVKTKFYTNQSEGTHIVEFGTSLNVLDVQGGFSIYNELTARGFSVKAEGGGTFGLGEAGSVSATRNAAVRDFGTAEARARRRATDDLSADQLDALKSPQDLFVEWLATRKIYKKLVNLRLDAKGNARATLEL